MVAKRRDADSPWKTMLRCYFQEAVEFFFPEIAGSIDWSSTPVFLDKEFERLSPDASIGKRYADQLVRVKLRGGQSLMLLIHLEIQASQEKNFAERMLIYAMRIFDRYHQLPCSLAILCDSSSTWRPKDYHLATPGSRLSFEFTAVKLLDYQQQWAALVSDPNPFAVVVMAHLKAQETQKHLPARKSWKFSLVRDLYERSYNREQILALFKFVDWILVLPESLDRSFWRDLKSYEEEKKMTYITSVEKIGFKRGKQEGKKETQQEIVRSMLEEQIPLETIARVTKLSISELERFANEEIQASQ